LRRRGFGRRRGWPTTCWVASHLRPEALRAEQPLQQTAAAVPVSRISLSLNAGAAAELFR
jgi:hypothetical protein